MASFLVNCCWSLMLLNLIGIRIAAARSESFVHTSGTRFIVDGHPFYINGFNAYWLPYFSMESTARPQVGKFMEQAAGLGLNVVRTWGFHDGGYRAIQTSPGVYSEAALQALDFVVSEAKQHGMRVLLSLSNNWSDWGGKAQYVQWAKDAGIVDKSVSEDAFFSDTTIRSYYKNYVKTILTRVNTITNVPYREEPAIFAWELMNEPRCPRDPSGKTLAAWIEEMAAFLKSIDANHMVEVGSEGFYDSSNNAETVPGAWSEQQGTDFIRDHDIANIDFATAHSYSDQWLPEPSLETQIEFATTWINEHVADAASRLRKPVLFAELGLSHRKFGYENLNRFLSAAYASLLPPSQASSSAAAGVLVWQLFGDFVGLDWDDGYAIVLSSNQSTISIIAEQSQRLAALNK